MKFLLTFKKTIFFQVRITTKLLDVHVPVHIIEGLRFSKFLENFYAVIKTNIVAHDYLTGITGYWSSANILLIKSQFSLTEVTFSGLFS